MLLPIWQMLRSRPLPWSTEASFQGTLLRTRFCARCFLLHAVRTVKFLFIDFSIKGSNRLVWQVNGRQAARSSVLPMRLRKQLDLYFVASRMRQLFGAGFAMEALVVANAAFEVALEDRWSARSTRTTRRAS